MAATDAKPVPQKNVAYRVTFPILDADGDLVTGAASLDSEVSIDGAAFADCTNEATEIATSSGVYYLDLTASEMNGDTIAVIIKTGTAGAKTTVLVFYPEEAGDIRVNVTQFGGTNGTFSGGRPEVNASHWGGTAVGSTTVRADLINIAGAAVSTTTAQLGVNVVQISGDGPAADNLEAALDGTGGVTITAAVTGNITGNLSGSVGSVTGNVGGSVASVAAGGITASSIATGAIDADALATDAVNEIADGILDRNMATGTDSGSPTVRTVRQALRASRNRVAVAAGTATVYKEDDSTASWTAAVTTTAGNPISEVDPASA